MKRREELQRLDRLWWLQERRARERFEHCREARDTAREAHGKQAALVDACAAELLAACVGRDAESAPSVTNLQGDATYRQHLRRTLGQERYYLQVTRKDLSDADRELSIARAAWLGARERVQHLPVLQARFDAVETARTIHQEASELDEHRPMQGHRLGSSFA